MSENLDLNFAQILNITIAEGNTFSFSMLVKNEEDEDIDLTAFSITMTIVDSKQNKNIRQILTNEDGIIVGVGQLGFKKDLTLPKDRYYYYLKVTGSDQISTNWLEGAFIIV